MKFYLQNRQKINQFVTILSLLKTCNEFLNIEVKETNQLYIQVLDKSKVCLCQCTLNFDWFDKVEHIHTSIKCTTSSVLFHNIMNSISSENMGILFEINHNDDNININTFNLISFNENIVNNTHSVDLNDNNNNQSIESSSSSLSIKEKTKENKNSNAQKNIFDINKYFIIPLINEQQDLFEISDIDYNIEFNINTKIINDILHQISLFGSVLNIYCDEDIISFSSSKDSNGEMKAVLKTDDLDYCVMDEDLELNLEFSLSYLTKYCITQKLTENVNINISANYPAKIKYILSDSGSNISFHIAPKISEE